MTAESKNDNEFGERKNCSPANSLRVIPSLFSSMGSVSMLRCEMFKMRISCFGKCFAKLGYARRAAGVAGWRESAGRTRGHVGVARMRPVTSM